MEPSFNCDHSAEQQEMVMEGDLFLEKGGGVTGKGNVENTF